MKISLFLFLPCFVLAAYGNSIDHGRSRRCRTCPDDWTFWNGNCYRFFSSQSSWGDAELSCNGAFTSRDSHLVSIHSADEQLFVYTFWEENGGTLNRLWIGLNDFHTENVFVWSDGTPVDYTSWIEGEPNNSNGNEQAVHLRRNNGNWNDERDWTGLPYVCKFTATA